MTRLTRPRDFRTTIEDHPFLLALFGARHPAISFLFAGPLLVLLIGRAWYSDRSAGGTAVEIGAGLIYWTFFEYAFHRWFYHWRPRRPVLRRLIESFHVYHHRNPSDRRVYNAGPLLALPLTMALCAPIVALGAGPGTTATVMIGTVAGYWFYEWCHYMFHVRTFERGWLARMQRFHLGHHEKNWGKNFGVTNPFWDRLFGTAGDRSGAS